MRYLAALATLFLFGGAARAARPPKGAPKKYAVRDMKIEGNASDAERKLLTERVWNSIELTLADRRDELVHAEEVERVLGERPPLRECYEKHCLLQLGDLVKANRLLSIRITRSGAEGQKGDWMVRILDFAVDSGHLQGPYDVPCNSCTADELVGDLAHSLIPVFNSDESVPLCTLKVDTAPPGGTVLVDTTELGKAPFAHTIAAGRHTVAVSAEGYAAGQTDVDCPAGASQNMLFTLSASGTSSRLVSDGGEKPAHRSPVLKIVGGALLALGAAGVISGAVAIARDGNQACDRAPGQTQCSQVYDTNGLGIGLIAAGSVAVVGGVVALVVDAMKGRQAAAVTPTAAVSANGGVFGLSGTF
jgi:hypothetical protein